MAFLNFLLELTCTQPLVFRLAAAVVPHLLLALRELSLVVTQTQYRSVLYQVVVLFAALCSEWPHSGILLFWVVESITRVLFLSFQPFLLEALQLLLLRGLQLLLVFQRTGVVDQLHQSFVIEVVEEAVLVFELVLQLLVFLAFVFQKLLKLFEVVLQLL